jgi:hypothetical protein
MRGLASAVALAWALSLGALWAARQGHFESWRHPANAPATGSFRLRDAHNPAARFSGGVVPEIGAADAWQGTYINGDAFTGRLVSDPFPVTAATLFVPIAGYPARTGNELAIEWRGADGHTGRTVFGGSNPGETGHLWVVDAAGWVGGTARLILDDGLTTPCGWLAVGSPQNPPGPATVWLLGVPRNYGWYALAALALSGLLLVPGMALRTGWPRALPDGAAVLPLPGLLGLVLGGLGLWLVGVHRLEAVAELWIGGVALTAALLAVRWGLAGPPFSAAEVHDLAAWGGVAIGALAFGVLPLRVDQEYDGGTTAQGRMIASPPDMRLPYDTAAFFLRGFSGRDDHRDYFGEDWSVASRGPLSPLGLAGTDALFGEHPPDPPNLSRDAWPASRDGYYLARIWGILTNSLVVVGGIGLARRLTGGTRSSLAAAWLCAAPAVAINVDFVWPKLLATYFLLLAVSAALRPRRLGGAVVWSVLAYLSHPVGGLFIPAIALFVFLDRELGCRAGRAAGRALRYGLGCAVGLAPWLVYRAWVGKPDPFVHYPLGDGRGTAPALSAASWLICRWHNLELTAIPGAFFRSNHMTGWIEGPLSGVARWGIGYAKALPGAVGLGAYLMAVCLIFRRRALPASGPFRLALLAAPLALMLIFWGYSDDGLGRNCLEPVSVMLIVWAAAAWPARWRGWRWLIGLAALESVSVRMIGLLADPSFSPRELSAESLILSALALAAAVGTPAVFLAVGGRKDLASNHPA